MKFAVEVSFSIIFNCDNPSRKVNKCKERVINSFFVEKSEINKEQQLVQYGQFEEQEFEKFGNSTLVMAAKDEVEVEKDDFIKFHKEQENYYQCI
jgi:hypothetical protein